MSTRPATPADVPVILALIQELAEYEREPGAVVTTEADLHEALFPDDGQARVYCHVAEVPGEGQDEGQDEVVGMALWFVNFSTWTGRHGIWLEDLFVRPDHRGGGHGKALLAELAGVCVERGWARLEWTVLDWNQSSIAFYRSLGAGAMADWTSYRLTGDALTRLGTRET